MKKLLIDVPSIYVGTITEPSDLTKLEGKELGLTKDGMKLSFVPNIREVEFDGKNGRKIKGMERILAWECTAECKGLELSDNALQFSLIKKDSTFTNEGYEKYTPSNDIVYQDIVIVGKMHGSKPIVVIMKNCYNPQGCAIETKDSNEGTYDFKAESHYDYDPLKDAQGTNPIPCEIYLPKTTTIE